jgi:hypothetical protein
MLVLFGVALFRKLMKLVDVLGDLGAQVSGAGFGTVDSGHRPGDAAGASASARAVPAVFANRDRLAEVVADRRFERLHRRQLRRDRAIRRGKLFETLPVTSKDFPHAQ